MHGDARWTCFRLDKGWTKEQLKYLIEPFSHSCNKQALDACVELKRYFQLAFRCRQDGMH